MQQIIIDNIQCLTQGIEQFKQLDGDRYKGNHEQVASGSIGAHIRHNIDHYQCLFDGLECGRVDYDSRSRDPRIETDAAYASELMATLIERLGELSVEQIARPVAVKMDCGSNEADAWSQSTIYRELQFLVSHTIHHYALVALLCRLVDVVPHDTFGVAPSTLKHRALQHA